MFRHHGDRRKNWNGVHAIDPGGQAQCLKIIGAGRARRVGDEKHVKLATLDGLGRLHPALDVLATVVGGARKSPARHVVIAITREKQGELHLAFGVFAGGKRFHFEVPIVPCPAGAGRVAAFDVSINIYSISRPRLVPAARLIH